MQKIYSAGKKRSNFSELWQRPKDLSTMEMNEAGSDIYNEGYTCQFQPASFYKIQ